MRKLVVLMLVLGMASLANAGIVLTLSAPASVTVGDIITVNMNITGLPTNGIGGWDINIGPSAVAKAAITGDGSSTFGWTNFSGGNLESFEYGPVSGSPVHGISAGGLQLSEANTNTNGLLTLGTNGLAASFTFLSKATGTVSFVLSLNSAQDKAGNDIGGDAQLVSSGNVTINPVPEPATLAILGLGGLLLRRKK